MTCERYWREGIVLVERGLADPHRDGCEDCTRAHASRQELIEALPLIGAGYTGDPNWQANVWRRIDAERAPAPRRWQWSLAGALTVACAVALWIGLVRLRPGTPQPDEMGSPIEILAEGGLKRSKVAHVGDLLRVKVRDTSDVWIYGADRLVLRCRARQVSEGCLLNPDRLIAETILSIPVEYTVFVVREPPAAPPRGVLDSDRAALISADIHYDEYTVMVR